MFYCDECRTKNNWPESAAVSFGPCEICGHTKPCFDVPSYCLPKTDPNHPKTPDSAKVR